MKETNTYISPACTPFESKKKNKYLYDLKKGTSMLCHPLLHHIIELHNAGTDVNRWLKQFKGGPVQIRGYGTTSREELDYYYQKFLVLKDNGFFSTVDKEHRLSGRLTAKEVKETLANVGQVVFEVTDACNLKCEYCGYGKFYSNYDRRESKKLSVGTAKNVLNYLVDLMNSPLNRSHDRMIHASFYGGEPLLNFPFIREIVAYAEQLKSKTLHNYFNFSMTTNAILLEKYMDFLVKHNFQLNISLDGNERNNSYRVFQDGTPAYHRILKNVKALRTKYPGYFKKRVDFNVVFHNRNSVSEVHRYFKDTFDKTPGIFELNTTGIKESMREEFRETYANINESLYQAEDYSLIEKDMFIELPNVMEAARFVDFYGGFHYRDYNEFLCSGAGGEGQAEIVRIPTGTCLPFSRKLYITVNGKILPCERISHRYSLGYADEHKVELDFEKIAAVYNSYYDKLKQQCGTCANCEACLQCIFHLNIAGKEPRCSGLIDAGEFSQFLSSRVSYLEENPGNHAKLIKGVSFE
jgi:uncharacterized protein